MTRITYRDVDREGAFQVTWQGVKFVHNEPVELDPVEHAGLIASAKLNRWFEVVEANDPKKKASEPAKTSAYDAGRQAAEEGKPVTAVPASWRGKQQGDDWVRGHEHRSTELKRARGAREPTEAEKSARASAIMDAHEMAAQGLNPDGTDMKVG